MGLDIYFRRDCANILRATACASKGSAGVAFELLSDPEVVVALAEIGVTPQHLINIYQSGVRDALVSVGLAFGLEPVGQVRAGASQVSGLLWAEVPRE